MAMPSTPRKSCQFRHKPCPELLLRMYKNLHPFTTAAEAMSAVRGKNAADGIRFASQICSTQLELSPDACMYVDQQVSNILSQHA